MVYLDPFRDLRSGYFFSVSASGVLWDGTLFNDMGSDDSWDGVWEGRARRIGAPAGASAGSRSGPGYTCEMRIPFSQLRFRPGVEQVWGFNFRRRIERRTELDQLAWTPKRGNGFVSRFPRLVGIEDGRRSRSITPEPWLPASASNRCASFKWMSCGTRGRRISTWCIARSSCTTWKTTMPPRRCGG